MFANREIHPGCNNTLVVYTMDRILNGEEAHIKSYIRNRCIPIMVFWYLDAFYLCQERLYRNLYEKVRRQSEDEIDFSMNAAAPEFRTEKTTVKNCFLSKTILVFYLPLAMVPAGVLAVASWI